MKPEEAIKAIKGLENIIEYWTHRPDEVVTANLAIQALEKQVAKKPIICGENPDGTHQFKCPECGRLWWGKSYITKYCDKCGNLIDRSESDE